MRIIETSQMEIVGVTIEERHRSLVDPRLQDAFRGFAFDEALELMDLHCRTTQSEPPIQRPEAFYVLAMYVLVEAARKEIHLSEAPFTEHEEHGLVARVYEDRAELIYLDHRFPAPTPAMRGEEGAS